MILIRDTLHVSGILGTLRTDDDEEICKTLEHAYAREDGTFFPKVPAGRYLCVRGIHQLSRGGPFETFEITNVPGRWGILFHAGNTNKDSDGCVLLGKSLVDQDGYYMLKSSRIAFYDFLSMLKGVYGFNLTVIGG